MSRDWKNFEMYARNPDVEDGSDTSGGNEKTSKTGGKAILIIK